MRILGIGLILLLQTPLFVRTVVVVLPVTVTDSRDQRVSGLTQANFAVYDDGRLQPVTLFLHGAAAVTLGLVIDHSTSMRDNISGVTAALTAFTAVARPDDEMFVVDFNEHVSQPLAAGGVPFTNDPRAIAAAVGAMPAKGQTALYDAIVAGLEQVAQGRSEKRTLIVVSDGGDNASRHTHADVQALARESGVVIYAIGLRGSSAERSPKALERLAEDTGGIAFFPDSPYGVSSVLTEIVRDLRQQYTIGFSPDSEPGTFHTIEVKASVPGGGKLDVRTRAGYLVPKGQR